ncbi:hypothetical protein E8E14_000693 [Neopestalotiopsis sp. 37M]|nr:hypothetical protein E8E14_000693 [Neopestalotiopsis sp. 37M]
MAAGKTQAEKPEQAQTAQKSAAALEEDDEFEDFPVEDWPENETEKAAQAAQSATEGEGKEGEKYLWEKSWDDDDTSDDFSAQLREELRKVDAAKRK